MKTKAYRLGSDNFKSYFKEAGAGWEVGFKSGNKKIFVGNFVHRSEANQWYTMMNKEITHFAEKYWVGPKYSKNWYTNFFKNHLYHTYYKFLDKLFTRHQRTFNKAVSTDQKKYMTYRKKWNRKDSVAFARRAA